MTPSLLVTNIKNKSSINNGGLNSINSKNTSFMSKKSIIKSENNSNNKQFLNHKREQLDKNNKSSLLLDV